MSRGVQDVRIAVVDGLKSLPEAVTATVQTCILRLARHSLNHLNRKRAGQSRQSLGRVNRLIQTDTIRSAPLGA